MERWLSFAKFNVYLAVLGRRGDGFHDLDTLLQSVSLADTLTCETLAGTAIEVTCDDPSVPEGPGNLVWRAVALLQERRGVRRGLRVHIAKRIPPQAGLGGGSSNAACALVAADRLWRLGLTVEELERLAAEIGSDVPFFVRGGAQRARGRGERLAPCLSLPHSIWVIVKPRFGLETARVYGQFSPRLTSREAQISMVLENLAKRDLVGVAESMFNDLESAAQCVRPQAGEVRSWMTGCGMRGVVLAGSGSAWVGHCPQACEAAQIEAAARRQGWQAWRVEPVKRGWSEAE